MLLRIIRVHILDLLRLIYLSFDCIFAVRACVNSVIYFAAAFRAFFILTGAPPPVQAKALSLISFPYVVQ